MRSAPGSRRPRSRRSPPLGGTALAEDRAFDRYPGFDAGDSLVIDPARFTVWAGLQAPAAGVHPRVVHRLRRQLFERLAARFSPR